MVDHGREIVDNFHLIAFWYYVVHSLGMIASACISFLFTPQLIELEKHNRSLEEELSEKKKVL